METPAHGNIEMDLLQKKLFQYEITFCSETREIIQNIMEMLPLHLASLFLNKNISVWEQMTNWFFPILNLIWQPANLLVQGWFFKKFLMKNVALCPRQYCMCFHSNLFSCLELVSINIWNFKPQSICMYCCLFGHEWVFPKTGFLQRVEVKERWWTQIFFVPPACLQRIRKFFAFSLNSGNGTQIPAPSSKVTN